MNADLSIEAVSAQVSCLLNDRVGLRAESSHRGRLMRCIRDDVAARGTDDLGGYLDSLLADGRALQELLNRVTVQETAFFRHPEHFEVVTRDLFPALPPGITIWSAGCANGQEAYSLAMLLEEHDIAGSVIATDLSTAALARTTEARYRARELTGLSPERLARHLSAVGDTWQVNPNVRARVSTLHYNLLDPIPAQVAGCQIVFCRNVLIYFTPEHAANFLGRLADACPAASLFLGGAETMWQLSDRFETVPAANTFSYRRRPDSRTSIRASVDNPGSPPATHRSPDVRTPRRPLERPSAPRPKPTLAPLGQPHRDPDQQDSDPNSQAVTALGLAQAGQHASTAGDFPTAVVAFRKCAYLTPRDPMAHLHLGLALETVGDRLAAQRAYAAARHALLEAEPDPAREAAAGYTAADLLRLLDNKLQGVK